MDSPTFPKHDARNRANGLQFGAVIFAWSLAVLMIGCTTKPPPVPVEAPAPPFVEHAPRISRIIESLDRREPLDQDSLKFIETCFGADDDMVVGMGIAAYWKQYELGLIKQDELLALIEAQPLGAKGSIMALRAAIYLPVSANLTDPKEQGRDPSLADASYRLTRQGQDETRMSEEEWSLTEQSFKSLSKADLGIGGEIVASKRDLAKDERERILEIVSQTALLDQPGVSEYIAYLRKIVIFRNPEL